MAKILNVLKYFFLKIDLFGSNQLLRYKGEGCYQTLTGGVVTFFLFIVFSILFMQNLTSMMNKDQINAMDATYFLQNPSHTAFKVEDTKFIFGIGITGLNLNEANRYFDITFAADTYSFGKRISSIPFQLQPCQQQQWAQVNEIGKTSFNKIQLNTFLCPKPNQLIQIQGKFTSPNFKLMKMRVSKCKNSTDPSRPCYGDDKLQNLSNFNLNFYFMNAYINSGNLQPVDYYLEDRNYFPFTVLTTIASNIYLSEHIINTDNSQLPYQNIQSDSVLLVRQLAEVKNSVAVVNQYITVYLRKSPQYIESTRSFQKIDGLFSYIGGLFGFAVTIFFVMTFYTETSYEIQMGDKLFYYEQTNPLQAKQFNFLYFIGFKLFNLLKMLNIELPWIRMKKYHQCREQVEEQLDLSLLMNKITFLEKCMNILFEDHQFRAIYLQQKPTVDEAEVVRLNHGLNKIIHKKSIRINNKVQQRMKIQRRKILEQVGSLNSAKSECVDLNLLSQDIKGKQHEKPFQNIQNEERLKASDILKSVQGQSNQQNTNNQIPIDLIKMISQYIVPEYQKTIKQSARLKRTLCYEENKIIEEEINKIGSQELIQIQSQNIQGNIKFISTAINDIRLVEEEARNGDKISQKIYDKLNTEITKEQFLVLKSWKKITDQLICSKDKQEKIKTAQSHPQSKEQMDNIFVSLFKGQTKSSIKNSQKKDDPGRGLEIILQTNDRIERTLNL